MSAKGVHRTMEAMSLLKSRIARLEAEVAVRTVEHVPIEWEERTTADKRPQRRSAFQSGYEAGYRGQALTEIYMAQWMQDSYERGWETGRRQSEERIRQHVERQERR
jgi:hypothetical protein